jgi:hypothetical protein
MPLNHNDDVVIRHQPRALQHPHEDSTLLTPTDYERKQAKREQEAAFFAQYPKVVAAQARLDALIEAGAAGPVIDRAQRRLDDAKSDVMETHSLAHAATKAKALAASKEAARRVIERETLARMNPAMPKVMIAFGRVRVTMLPERALDATTRLHCYGDFHNALQLIQRDATTIVGFAQRGAARMVDPEVLAAELADVCRRSIHAGCLQIQIVEA